MPLKNALPPVAPNRQTLPTMILSSAGKAALRFGKTATVPPLRPCTLAESHCVLHNHRYEQENHAISLYMTCSLASLALPLVQMFNNLCFENVCSCLLYRRAATARLATAVQYLADIVVCITLQLDGQTGTQPCAKALASVPVQPQVDGGFREPLSAEAFRDLQSHIIREVTTWLKTGHATICRRALDDSGWGASACLVTDGRPNGSVSVQDLGFHEDLLWARSRVFGNRSCALGKQLGVQGCLQAVVLGGSTAILVLVSHMGTASPIFGDAMASNGLRCSTCFSTHRCAASGRRPAEGSKTRPRSISASFGFLALTFSSTCNKRTLLRSKLPCIHEGRERPRQ